ncbi:MAG: 4-alpha-glucanotransferase, partial [Deltaproteobacteria bacterium]|nr:4-alpha-glucanotransferase [Deltaproteobacteria bacterium]
RCRPAVERDPGYRSFRTENPWLDGYVAFRVLKEVNCWRSWEEWSAGRPPARCLAEAEKQWGERLDHHRFLQWIAAQQLRSAREYACNHGVLLKGDIPILVGRDSADVWLHPELFHLDATAGAPPDMYAAEGQNWGFPTYDWDALARLDYSWWRQRLAAIEQYFHLYRIDHVVGFFRIWTIPLGERTGLKGRFVPEDEQTWGRHGRQLLSMMLDSCALLPIGEDLGTIPDVCRATLNEMGIPGLKVARWEKRWHGDRSFIPPREYPFLSVATSSTHDSETLAGWWQAFPEEREQLYRELGLGHHAPAELTLPLAERLLGDLAHSSSAFTILPLNDVLFLGGDGYLFPRPEQNRVNVPGTCTPTNWTFRLPRPLERLLADARLNDRLKELLRRS